MSIHLFGVNFRTASIAVRESLSCDRASSTEVLRSVAQTDPGFDAVMLSTCNRTELYVAADGDVTSIENRLKGSPLERLPLLRSETRYHVRSTSAVRHLCKVACGLDSAVLGDAQILGQVKTAFADARSVGSLGGALYQAFVCAINAGKLAHTTTGISKGSASVGAALVGMIVRRRPEVVSGTLHVVVVGAGKVAGQICRQLTKRGVGRITIVNRTPSRAAAIAGECGARTVPLADSEAVMRQADVIVTAVRSQRPVLRGDMLQRVVARRTGQRVLVVDAGLPRNVEVTPGIEILNVDSIVAQQENGLGERRASVPAVERIVEDAVGAWVHWCEAQPLERAIKELFAEVERVSQRNARRLARLGGVSDGEAETALVRGFKRRLHSYVREIRAR